jgi:hypothetical protein
MEKAVHKGEAGMSECNHDWVRGAWSAPRCRLCGIRKEDADRIAELEKAEVYWQEFYQGECDQLAKKNDELEAKLATLQGGLQSICDTHGYAVPKPVLNNLLAALEDDND